MQKKEECQSLVLVSLTCSLCTIVAGNPELYHPTDTCRLTCLSKVGNVLVLCWPKVGNVSVFCRPNVGIVLAESR